MQKPGEPGAENAKNGLKQPISRNIGSGAKLRAGPGNAPFDARYGLFICVLFSVVVFAFLVKVGVLKVADYVVVVEIVAVKIFAVTLAAAVEAVGAAVFIFLTGSHKAESAGYAAGSGYRRKGLCKRLFLSSQEHCHHEESN